MQTQQNNNYDRLKWLAVAVLLIVGVVANYYYSAQPWPLRLLGGLLLLLVLIVIALQTQQGKQTLEFAREARVELRKVHWPTRQETIQTTLIVGAMVIVLALMLWGIDSILMWLVSWLMGQRG